MKSKILTLIMVAVVIIFSCNVVPPVPATPEYLATIPNCFSGTDKGISYIPESRASTTSESIDVFLDLVKMYLGHIDGAIDGANGIIYAIEKAKSNQHLSDGTSWEGEVNISIALPTAWCKIDVGSTDAEYTFTHDYIPHSYRNRIMIKTSQFGTDVIQLAYTKLSETRFIGEFTYDYKTLIGIEGTNITNQPKFVYFRFDSEDSNSDGNNHVLAKATWQDNSADTTGFPIRVAVHMVTNGNNFAIDGMSYHNPVGTPDLFSSDVTNDSVANDNYKKRVYCFYGSANKSVDKGQLNIAVPDDSNSDQTRNPIFASDFTSATEFSVGAVVKRAISYYICTNTSIDIVNLRQNMNSEDGLFSDGSGSVVTVESSSYTKIDNIMQNSTFWDNLSDDLKLWWSIKNPVYFNSTGYCGYGYGDAVPSEGGTDYLLAQSMESYIAGSLLLIRPAELLAVNETIIAFPW